MNYIVLIDITIALLMKKYVLNNDFLRFAIVGIIAFAIHYTAYLFLLLFLRVNIAYTIGYCLSLLCNLLLTAKFTFKCNINAQRTIGFILAHTINYLMHIGFLNLMLFIGLNKTIAPLIVLCIVVPINFILVKSIFTKKRTMAETKVLISFDMEEFDLPIEMGDNKYTLDDGLSVSSEGAKFIVEAINSLSIHATFFCTLNFAKNNTELIKGLRRDGHEVASHGCSHLLPSSTDPLISKSELERITGEKCYGYRQPRMKEVDNDFLKKCGYLYNSSLNPTFIPGRYCHLLSPRTVHEKSEILQFPMSVTPTFRIPLFWLSFHILPLSLYKFLSKITIQEDGYLLLYFHPWEFYPLDTINSVHIPTYIKFHTGKKMRQRFLNYLEYLKKEGCEFITIQEYSNLLSKNDAIKQL